MGIAAGSIGLSDLQQEASTPSTSTASEGSKDLVASLEELKRALEAGLIDQSEHDAAKAKVLGLS